MRRRMSSTPENITHSMADDYMKVNAEFRSKAGIDTYIERRDDGKCCEWCSKLAGRYRYPDQVPRDVFKRHDNCGCLVSYTTPGGMRQNVHSKRGWNDEDQREYLKQLDEEKKRKREERKARWGDSYSKVRHERIQFTPKQAAEREKIVKEKIAEKRKMALTKGKENGIIKLEATSPFKNPKTPLSIDSEMQGKHIRGRKRYRDYMHTHSIEPSYLTISEEKAQELVNKFHGTGILKLNKNGEVIPNEIIIDNDEVVGVVVNNLTGAFQKTTAFKIQYGSEGTHIVPTYESQKQYYLERRGRNGYDWLLRQKG